MLGSEEVVAKNVYTSNGVTEADALSAIFAEYARDDDPKNSLSGLSYNEPPMIQFQYLKAVIDKLGQNYEFGTKYYDIMTGEIYLDIETGLSKTDDQQEQYKYNYEFRLALAVDIDDNDLIRADVSFNIKLTQGSNEYNTQWYVSMDLEYDMNNANPTYKLVLKTDNQEGELPFEEYGYVDEYDYVEVKNNKIIEWRKFCIESNTKLIVDASHQTFDSYANQNNFEYKLSSCKWYKDGTLHKFTRLNHNDGADMKLRVARVLYEGMGLNSTDISATEFINKQGTQNNVIDTMYKEFKRILGQDIIYDLVCDADGNGGDHGTAATTGIKIYIDNGETFDNGTIQSDATIADMFTNGDTWGYNNGSYPSLFYVDRDGNTVERVEWTAFDDNFTFTMTIGDQTETVGVRDRLFDIIDGKFGGLSAIGENRELTLTITEKQSRRWTTSLTIYLSDIENGLRDKEARRFPKDLSDLGMPAYETKSGSFNVDAEKSDRIILTITDSNAGERYYYINKLINEGFVLDQESYYVKIVGSNVLKIRVNDFDWQDLNIDIISTANSNYFSSWQGDAIKGLLENKFNNFPAPKNNNLLYYLDAGNKYIYIYGMTEQERGDYLASIGALDNVIVNEGAISFIYEDKTYTLSYNVENNNTLYIELDPSKYGASDALYVIVNTMDIHYFIEEPGKPSYVIIEDLVVGDRFKFSSEHIPEIENAEEYFDYDSEERGYMVLRPGSYRFCYAEGRMSAEYLI